MASDFCIVLVAQLEPTLFSRLLLVIWCTTKIFLEILSDHNTYTLLVSHILTYFNC